MQRENRNLLLGLGAMAAVMAIYWLGGSTERERLSQAQTAALFAEAERTGFGALDQDGTVVEYSFEEVQAMGPLPAPERAGCIGQDGRVRLLRRQQATNFYCYAYLTFGDRPLLAIFDARRIWSAAGAPPTMQRGSVSPEFMDQRRRAMDLPLPGQGAGAGG
jgi:hypothetical protein